MCSSILCLAVVAVGIESGWQPLPNGGLEYLIQIEPHMLERLRQGEEIASDFAPEVKGVRSVRVFVGTKDLPRRALPAPAGDSLTLPENVPILQPSGPVLDPFRLPGTSGVDQTAAVRPTEPRQAPNPLDPAPDSKPIHGQPASFQQDVAQDPPFEQPPPRPTVVEETVPPLKWTVTIGALVASVGGMLYLGWVAWDYRRRYHRLLNRLFEGGYHPLVGGES